MSRRRPRGPLEWAVRIALALVLVAGGLLAGRLISGHWGFTTVDSSTTATTSPLAAETKALAAKGLLGPSVPSPLTGSAAATAAKAACAGPVDSGISDSISEAADGGGVSAIEQMTQGNGLDPLRQAIGITGPDAIIGKDALAFFKAAVRTDSTGDLTYVENSDTVFAGDCQSLGLA